MSYLLDTCVISEFTRRTPENSVIQWLSAVDEEELYLSVLTIGEIRHGIERMEPSPRKEALNTWLEEGLLARFSSRIIPLETRTMLHWGEMVARLERQGRRMPAFDSLIAATASTNDLELVTRNISDFEFAGLVLVNPWEASG